MGGNLALQVAESLVLTSVAWFPVVSGEKLADECVKFNVNTQYAAFGSVQKSSSELLEELRNEIPLNVLGFQVSQSMLTELRNIELSNIALASHTKRLIVLKKRPRRTGDPQHSPI